MSILIKGLKMPTSCLRGGCPIDGASCSLWEEKCWKSPDEPYRKRHPKCPLIPVPPHGPLIDADAILSQYNGNILTAQNDYAEGLRDAAEDIKAAPTIIEAEEDSHE